MYRKLYLIGIAAYLFLLVLSVFFYKERIIFLDCSYMIFQLVRTGSFCIEVYRFGDAIAQILPLLSYKMGFSLATIALSYSLGLILVPFSCYLVCGSVLKQYRFALVILLVSFLFASHAFYWTQSQVPQGICMLIVVFALLWDKTVNAVGFVRWVAIALLLVILGFFHPLIAFVLGYSLLFFLLHSKIDVDKKVLYLIGTFFISILIVKAIFFRTPYERHSLSGLKNVVRLFPHYIALYSNKEFLKNCITKYYWIPVMFFSIAGLYLQTKEYKKLLLFVFTVGGYLLLVNIMYPDAQTPIFYIENLYLPLGLCIGLSVVFDLLPVLEQKRTALALMVLIMLTGCIRVYATHEYYMARLDWERNFLAKNGDKKIIANAQKANAGILQMLWGTPYEFWLLSTIEQGHSASIIIDDDPPHRDWAKEKTNALVVNWNVFPYKGLDPRYFRYTDTLTGYIIETTPNHTPNP